MWKSGSCREVRDELQSLVREQIINTEQHSGDLAVFIERLTSALTHLQELPAKDEPCDPDCDFLHDRTDRSPIPIHLIPVPVSAQGGCTSSVQGTSWADGLELVDDDERLVAHVGMVSLRLLAERTGLPAGWVVGGDAQTGVRTGL